MPRKSPKFEILLRFPGGETKTRECNKQLREILQSAGGRHVGYTTKKYGYGCWYHWSADFAKPLHAFRAIEQAFLTYTDLGGHGDGFCFEFDGEQFPVPQAWSAMAAAQLPWRHYRERGGGMEMVEFIQDCLRPGGLERVYVEEGLPMIGCPQEMP